MCINLNINKKYLKKSLQEEALICKKYRKKEKRKEKKR
jgi:hypothetical protein